MNNITDLKIKYSKAFIFGKGPTFVNRIKESEDELYFGVNDTINILDTCDVFVINDYETIKRINKDKLKQIKYILTPEYPHINEKPDPKYNWTIIKKEVEDYFSGSFLIYHLATSQKKNKAIPSFPSVLSGSNTAIDMISLFLKNIKEVELYGVGILNLYEYNSIFNQQQNSVYTESHIYLIRNNIISTCKKYSLKYTFH